MFSTAGKRSQTQRTSDSTAPSYCLSEEHLQGRGGMGGCGQRGWLGPQGVLLTAGRASGTPGDGTSQNPKAAQCVK